MSYLTVVRRLRSSLLLFLALTTLIAIVRPVPGLAEDGIDRKVKSRVSPAYPEIARKMGLSGTVRLEVVVAPNGSVKETKVIGGHPILVTAALDAVKKWKFEPAGAESSGTVEFKFSPGE